MSKLQKATEELNSMIKSEKKKDARGAVSKAISSLQRGMALLKGVDLDAKDYESSSIDAYDTRPRGHRGARQRNDAGDGYQGISRTPREDEDWNDNRNDHRVIVTGKPEVNEGHSEDEDWEDPEDPDLGDDNFYDHSKMGKKHSPVRDAHYKSENEDDEDDDGDEKEDKKKRMRDMRDKSEGLDHDLVKSEEDIYDELLASPEFTEVVEATPAVAHIADVMGKSFGEIFEEMYVVKSALASLMEANSQLLKMIQGQPVNSSAPGIIGKVGEANINLTGLQLPNANPNASTGPVTKSNMSTASAPDRLWHAETLRKLEDACNAEAITPEAFGKAASMLDSIGPEALKSIPANVRKTYSLE
jgi:hypothetical protein